MKDERLLSSSAGRGIRDAAAQNADELAKSLAMMHATLESTTDAILVTDESNQVRAFNEKVHQPLGDSGRDKDIAER